MLSLPNILTLLNLICGSIAIYGILSGLEWITLLSFLLALVFDFLDGFTARLLNKTSKIGKDLDSLADLISFGLLPAFLAVDMIERTIPLTESPVYMLVFLLVGGAALRLAVFNSTSGQNKGFSGMPTPAVGMILFGLWINLDGSPGTFYSFIANPGFILAVALTLTLLMNAPVRFIKFTLSKSLKIDLLVSSVLIFIFLIFLIFSWRAAVLITGTCYLIFSLLLPPIFAHDNDE